MDYNVQRPNLLHTSSLQRALRDEEFEQSETKAQTLYDQGLQHMNVQSEEIDRNFTVAGQLFAKQTEDLQSVHQRAEERTQTNHEDMLRVQETHRHESIRRDAQQQTLLDELHR